MADQDEVLIREGEETVRRTVVGGRPKPREQRRLRVPVGIEKVLYLAASDPSFRTQLEQDRQAALRRAELSASESNILTSVSNAQLAAMIGRIDVREHAKRDFMRAVATVALAAATSTSAMACKGEAPAVSPPQPPAVVQPMEQPDAVNAAADTIDIEAPPMPPPTGINPELDPAFDPPDLAPDETRAPDLLEIEPPPPASKGHRVDAPKPPAASRGISSDFPKGD